MSTEPEYLTFDQMVDLLEIEEGDHTLPGWGAPVRVRPLSVGEARQIAQDSGGSEDRAAQLMIAKCLVAPALTDAQVRVLWTKQAGKLRPLLDLLNAINGFGPPAQQAAQVDAAEAAFRAEAGAAV